MAGRVADPSAAPPRRAQVHSIVDEVIANGYMVEANKANVLEPIRVMRKAMAGSGKGGSDQ